MSEIYCLGIDSAARVLNVSTSQVNQMAALGLLDFVRTGEHVSVTIESILEMAEDTARLSWYKTNLRDN
ncbi:MAG: hypothetical protein WC566_11300 [Dehalococcoidia bacterium]